MQKHSHGRGRKEGKLRKKERESERERKEGARCQWLMPVIPATQAEIRRITVQSQQRQTVPGDNILKKPTTKIGLVEWLKV
jgi:hypothetical protein